MDAVGRSLLVAHEDPSVAPAGGVLHLVVVRYHPRAAVELLPALVHRRRRLGTFGASVLVIVTGAFFISGVCRVARPAVLAADCLSVPLVVLVPLLHVPALGAEAVPVDLGGLPPLAQEDPDKRAGGVPPRAIFFDRRSGLAAVVVGGRLDRPPQHAAVAVPVLFQRIVGHVCVVRRSGGLSCLRGRLREGQGFSRWRRSHAGARVAQRSARLMGASLRGVLLPHCLFSCFAADWRDTRRTLADFAPRPPKLSKDTARHVPHA